MATNTASDPPQALAQSTRARLFAALAELQTPTTAADLEKRLGLGTVGQAGGVNHAQPLRIPPLILTRALNLLGVWLDLHVRHQERVLFLLIEDATGMTVA